MPLTLLEGPIGSGKTDLILKRLHPYARRQAGLCVVPAEGTALELRQILLSQGEAWLGDVVLPFHLFIKKLGEEPLPLLSHRDGMLLLYQILNDLDLKYFKSASLGVARQASLTINILKKNLVDAADFRRLLSARSSRREKDLALIFERYEKEKEERGLRDEGDLFFAAVKQIRNPNKSLLKDIEFLAFDEFNYFNPGQIQCLKLLNEHLPSTEIVVSFPAIEDGKTLFAPYLEKTLVQLKKIVSKTERVKSRAPLSKPRVFNFVLRSPWQEIQFVTQEIARCASDTPPEEIAVCLRAADPCTTKILNALEDYYLSSFSQKTAPPLFSSFLHEALSAAPLACLPPAATIEEYVSSLRLIWKDNFKGGKWCDQDAQNHLSEQDVAKNMQALAFIDQTLNSLAAASKILKLEKIPRETFLNMLFAECSSAYIPAGQAAATSRIRLINFEEGVVHPPRVLFIPKAQEGHLPALLFDTLFFPHEGETTGRHPLEDIFPAPSFYLEREAYLFHRLITKTTGQIIFTHAAIDERGKENAPSGFLDPFEEPKPMEAQLNKEGVRGERAFLERLSHIAEIERERHLGQNIHPPYHGRLQDKAVRTTIKERFTQEILSPSHIETYAVCPFRFFAQRVLNLKPLEEITPEIQPRDKGSIIHAVLERFYRRHMKVFKQALTRPPATKTLERLLDEIVEEVFADFEKRINYSAKGLRPHEKKTARLLAHQVIEKELELARILTDPLLPWQCEWVFGEKEDTALELAIEAEKPARIKGRVDRVDASGDKRRFAVIDYKTGRQVGSVVQKIKKGLHLQLPLYVEAVRRLLLPQAEAVGGVMLAVQQGEKKHGFLKKSFNDVHYALSPRLHSILDDETWEELLRAALLATARHIINIRRADFGVNPTECPAYCEYEDVCRYRQKTADFIPTTGH